MDWLGRGYSAFMGDKAQPQEGPEIVDKLCDRIFNSTDQETRRTAVLGLKGLSREYQLEVGTKGMPILLHMLQQESTRMDLETTKAILDTLINVCGESTAALTPDAAASSSNPNQPHGAPIPAPNLGLQFTEILVKDSQNVVLVLGVLAETDFHVRYKAIELLKILLSTNRKQIQDCILASPMGVSRLMDLLEDPREVVRNEGLLVLIELTESNADIQKIIAFENAFERLLQIIYAESGCDGDVIVMDCLQLIENLLRDNVSNQNYFRESGLVMRLPGILNVVPLDPREVGHDFSNNITQAVWTLQRMQNVKKLLQVVRIFLIAENPNTPVNQKVMQNARLLTTVLTLALAEDTPNQVIAECFYAAGDLIRGNQDLQNYVESCTVANPPDAPTFFLGEVLHYLLRTNSVATKDFEFQTRMATLAFLEAYLGGNREAQLALFSPAPLTASHTKEETPLDPNAAPVPTPDAKSSLAPLLRKAYFDWNSSRKDPFRQWFASVLLTHGVMYNEKSKKAAMLVQVDDAMDLLNATMHSLMVATREDGDVRVLIGFLTFLAAWMYNFPKAVKLFLSEGANFAFLLEQMNQSSSVDPLVQGLAAFLLGICFEYNDDSVAGLTRSAIQSIVINRLGADQFTNRLNRLKDSKAFHGTSLEASMDMGELKVGAMPEVYFDPDFVEFFKSTYEKLARTVVNPKSLKQKQIGTLQSTAAYPSAIDRLWIEKEESQQQDSIIDSYKKVIAGQDAEMKNLRAQLAAMQEQLKKVSVGGSTLVSGTPATAAANGNSQPLFVGVVATTQTSVIPTVSASTKTSPTAAPNEDTMRKIAQLESEVQKWKTKASETQQEMEDLLVCLAEQDMEMGKLKLRLRELGEPVETDVDSEYQSEQYSFTEQK